MVLQPLFLLQNFSSSYDDLFGDLFADFRNDSILHENVGLVCVRCCDDCSVFDQGRHRFSSMCCMIKAQPRIRGKSFTLRLKDREAGPQYYGVSLNRTLRLGAGRAGQNTRPSHTKGAGGTSGPADRWHRLQCLLNRSATEKRARRFHSVSPCR